MSGRYRFDSAVVAGMYFVLLLVHATSKMGVAYVFAFKVRAVVAYDSKILAAVMREEVMNRSAQQQLQK